jgi:hypothetical protein
MSEKRDRGIKGPSKGPGPHMRKGRLAREGRQQRAAERLTTGG